MRSPARHGAGEHAVQFNILGPLEVVGPTGPIDVGGPQRRALLAALLVRANRPCSPDFLTEALWGDDVPENPRGLLQALIAHLRRALEPDRPARERGDVLASTPGGYVLYVGPAELDARRFEDLSAEGHELLASGEATRSTEVFGQALELWRGPALADVADQPFAMAEATRLEELRLSTIVAHADARLVLGRHGEVVGELQALADEHPLDEQLRRLLMLALYRSGRQADALRAYTALREQLVEELGVEPGYETRELERAILRQDPRLETASLYSPSLAVERTGVARPPLPALLGSMASALFVGRSAQRQALDESWREVRTGHRRTVFVGGEPGAGKTRLAAEAARAAYDAGDLVLYGRCDEDLASPYQPFVEALRQFASHTSDADLPRLLGRYGGELVRLVPDLAERAPEIGPTAGSDPELDRYRLYEAVADWLVTLSAKVPLVIVLDDLHWASRPTLAMLKHVIRHPEPMALLVVATFRDTDLDREHPLNDLLAEVRGSPSVDSVALPGLDPDDIGTWLTEAPGVDLEEAATGTVAGTLHADSGGNPLLVGELIAHLAEHGEVDSVVAPTGIREITAGRVAKLSPASADALEHAAVIGTEFDVDVLRDASDSDLDSLLTSLGEAEKARLVEPLAERGLHYRFTHSVIRRALYDGLPVARRLQLHRRVALAIERSQAPALDEHLDELAHHFGHAAAAGEAAKAYEYATRAGERALTQHANDDAIAFYERALELLDEEGVAADPDRERCRLRVALGRAQRLAGQTGYHETLRQAYRTADTLGDASLMGEAALAASAATYIQLTTVDEEQVAQLRAALDALDDDDSALRARLLVTLAAELTLGGEREQRQRLADEALAMARRLDDPVTLAQVLMLRSTATWDATTLADRLEVTAELSRLAEQLDDPGIEFMASADRFATALEAGDVDEADRALDRAGRLADELGEPLARWRVGQRRACRAMVAGRFDDAEALALETMALGQSFDHPDAFFNGSIQLFVIRLERRQLEGVIGVAERFVTENPSLQTPRATLAWALCEVGRHDDARDLLRDFAATGFTLPPDPTWLTGIGALSAACAELGDRDAAAELYERLRPFEQQCLVTPVYFLGSAASYLGRLATTLGRADQADAHFAAAVSVLERMGARAALARTRGDWAAMLADRRARGDVDRARECLRYTIPVAGELGMSGVAERARGLERRLSSS